MVDWREDDADIVHCCAECLELTSLTAAWKDDDLFISFEGREKRLSLQEDLADRHIVVCALNDLLSPSYEIRYVICSHGGDELAFAALSLADWQSLEKANPTGVAENFIIHATFPI